MRQKAKIIIFLGILVYAGILSGVLMTGGIQTEPKQEMSNANQIASISGMPTMYLQESFQKFTVGSDLAGQTPEGITWGFSYSGGGTTLTCGTAWSTGNNVGVLFNPGDGAYGRADGIFVTPMPTAPSASNQYAFSLLFSASGPGTTTINLYPDTTGAANTNPVAIQVCPTGAINYMGSGIQWFNSGLTWTPGAGTPLSLTILMTGAQTIQLSNDSGNTWTSNLTLYEAWTAPAEMFTFYTGTLDSGTAYFDNISTSWGSVLSNNGMMPAMHLQEDFQKFTVGSDLAGQTPEGITWGFSYSGGGTTLTCGTAWSTGNHVGVLYNPGGGAYGRADGIFVTPMPTAPSASNQYAFSLLFAASGSGCTINIYQDTSADVNDNPVAICMNGNGNIQYSGAGEQWDNSGLTWTPGAGVPIPIAIEMTGPQTIQISNDNGSTWTPNLTIWEAWTSPAQMFTIYSGTAANYGTLQFDNISTSWGVNHGSSPQVPAPVIMLIGAGYSISTNLVTLNIEINGSHLDTIWYTIDNGAPVIITSNVTFPLVFGIHTINVYANNTYGRVSSVTLVVSITYVPPSTIVIIVIVSGMSVGIVVSASYARARRKTKIAIQSKAAVQQSYVGGSPRENVDQSLAAINKRSRLLRVSMPPDEKPAEATASVGIPLKDPVIPKKNEAEEPSIDMEQRVANANQMASEVKIDNQVPRCIVHKGPISGLSYTCKHCHVVYCMKCYTYLVEAHENCWNCNLPLELVSTQEIATQDEFDDVPETQVTMFKPEILDKLDGIDLQPEVKEDILALLKEVPPEQRLARLDEILAEKPVREDEDWF